MDYKVKKQIKITKHISLIITQEHRIFLRWYGSDMLTFRDFREEFSWRKRIRKHLIVQSLSKFIVKRLAMYLLSKQYKSADAEGAYYNRPKILEHDEPVDFYSYCHDKECKKYCHGGAMKWTLHFRDLRLEAHSEYGLYLEVIRKFIIEPYRVPFC